MIYLCCRVPRSQQYNALYQPCILTHEMNYVIVGYGYLPQAPPGNRVLFCPIPPSQLLHLHCWVSVVNREFPEHDCVGFFKLIQPRAAALLFATSTCAPSIVLNATRRASHPPKFKHQRSCRSLPASFDFRCILHMAFNAPHAQLNCTRSPAIMIHSIQFEFSRSNNGQRPAHTELYSISRNHDSFNTARVLTFSTNSAACSLRLAQYRTGTIFCFHTALSYLVQRAMHADAVFTG
ncbi:hypothetical protein EDB19DRAFT_708621 [Suillus lakei]|nr:hypothetical protein EDB19DRAFT_708621 [Suillus lakei]